MAMTLKARLAQIAAPYKACTKKLKLKYANYKKFSWATKVKIRRCVMAIQKKKRGNLG